MNYRELLRIIRTGIIEARSPEEIAINVSDQLNAEWYHSRKDTNENIITERD